MDNSQFYQFLLGAGVDQHVFIVAPDNLGLVKRISDVLKETLPQADYHVFTAANLVVDDVRRQIVQDARMSPIAGSSKTHYFIHGLTELSPECAGLLLKTMEEVRCARFILQSSGIPRKLQTLQSRSLTVYLPFLSKVQVYGLLKLDNLDVQEVETLGLYDGTLDGTKLGFFNKDLHAVLAQQINGRGSVVLMSDEFIKSENFYFTYDRATRAQKGFTKFYKDWDDRQSKKNRRRLVAFLVSRRAV